MIGYTSLGTSNLKQATEFYDALFTQLQAQKVMEFEDFVVWATDTNKPAFSIHIPVDGKPYSVGNGVMVALNTDSTEQVDKIYQLALKLGAQDEGKPGYRADGFYAAYFRDLDGNKLNIHHMEG